MKDKIDKSVVPELVAAAQIAGQPETEFWDEVEKHLDEIDAAKELVKPRNSGTS